MALSRCDSQTLGGPRDLCALYNPLLERGLTRDILLASRTLQRWRDFADVIDSEGVDMKIIVDELGLIR